MRRLLGRLVLVILTALLQAAPVLAETVDVTFLLVNDVDRMTERDGRGGVARIAAVAKAERAAHQRVVFIHAGDAISPSLLSGFDEGAHVITLLNMLRPDIFVPGNHEFDFGPNVFRKRMSEAQFPLLAANLRDAAGERLPGFQDSRMLEFGGVKIGVVGLTDDASYVLSSPGDLKIAPIVATGLAQAKALRDAGAQLVVAVAHAARPTDNKLFESRAFDLIFSGDDRDLMLQFDGRTLMMESLAQGEFISAVDLAITTEEGKLAATWRPRFRIIDTADVQPDPEVQARVDGFEAEFSRDLDSVVGTTAIELDSRRAAVRTGEAPIGDMIADVMREAVDADVALVNSGALRAERVYPAGATITRRDVLAELPFGNRVVKIAVTGERLRAALENGFSQGTGGAGRFPQVSGMAVEADLKAPAGARVTSVTIDGAPLNAARTYTLATNEFVMGGGDGYTMLIDAPRILDERDGPVLAAAVVAYIRKRHEIAPAIEGRIKLSQ
jgi:2',3'-cyclic-nucleotide 2'-phosphodiesterase (5'-nucleotidase family)